MTLHSNTLFYYIFCQFKYSDSEQYIIVNTSVEGFEIAMG